MKNILFSLIITALVSNVSFCQKAKLIDVKGSEIAIILNIADDSSFKEYYLFQYDNIIISNLTATNFFVTQITKDMLKLNCDGKIITFTINQNYRNENEKVYFGYGLSKRLGNFSLIEDYLNPSSITNVILVNNKLNNRTITCHSGGEGATECAVTPSDINVGAATCSVTCSTGYHACCDDSKGECKCIVNKPVVKSLQQN